MLFAMKIMLDLNSIGNLRRNAKKIYVYFLIRRRFNKNITFFNFIPIQFQSNQL